MKVKVGFGQDSHRFSNDPTKLCILGGLTIENAKGFDADSDGDVILHSFCNAVTSITHVPILGGKAIELCHKHQIIDSRIYVEEAIKTLKEYEISHISFGLEGSYPRLQKHIESLRQNIAMILSIDVSDVGITITSGNGLTAFSKGEGLQSICILTVMKD